MKDKVQDTKHRKKLRILLVIIKCFILTNTMTIDRSTLTDDKTQKGRHSELVKQTMNEKK